MNYVSYIPTRKAPPPPLPVPLEEAPKPGAVRDLPDGTCKLNDSNIGSESISSSLPECSGPSCTEVQVPADQQLSKPLEEAINANVKNCDTLHNSSQEQQSSHPEYVLCGYLQKLSTQQKLGSNFFYKSSKSLGRKRWMVFSERSCKLFYYKSKGDTDALGEINITAATFNYDPEDPDGLFSIISDGRTYTLAAGDDKSRQHWLDSLQVAKLHYINTSKEVVLAPPRIQWYTALPSINTLPSPSTNFVDILHNIKSSAKNSIFSKASFQSTPTRSSQYNVPGSPFNSSSKNLPSTPSSPTTARGEDTRPVLRTRSQEELASKTAPEILKSVRPAPQPRRPTTLHITDPSDHINNNSEVFVEEHSVTLPRDVPRRDSSTSTTSFKFAECVQEAQINSHPSMENKNISEEKISPFQRTKAFSKSFTSRRTSPVKNKHFSDLRSNKSSGDGLSSERISPLPTSKDSQTQPTLRNKSESPGSESLSGLRQIGADLKASITRYSGLPNKRSLSVSVSEDQLLECADYKQLLQRLQQSDERLDSRTEELAAAKQGISLLQQDLALLHRQRQTQNSLVQSVLTDKHLLEILREKDRSLVSFEQTDCLQKNEIAELQQQHQQLREQIDLLATLLRAKDNAIRSISDELEDLKSLYAVRPNNQQYSKAQRSNSLTLASEQSLVHKQGQCMMPDHQCLSTTDQDSPLTVKARQSLEKTFMEEQHSSALVSGPSNSQVNGNNIDTSKLHQKTYQIQSVSASLGCDPAVLPLPPTDLHWHPRVAYHKTKEHSTLGLDTKETLPSSRYYPRTALKSIAVDSSKSPNSTTEDVSLLDGNPTVRPSSSFALSDASLSSPSVSSCYSREQSIPDSVFDDNVNPTERLDVDVSTPSNQTVSSRELESSRSPNINQSSLRSFSHVNDQNSSSRSDEASPALSVMNLNSSKKTQFSPRFFSFVASSANAKTNTTLDSVHFHRKMNDAANQRLSTDAYIVLPCSESLQEDAGPDNRTEKLLGEQPHRLPALSAALEETSRERDHYKESYHAYKTQNAFLHKQIIELSQASDMMKQREERLKYECSVWEAQFEQVRSKYLVLLNDLHSPPCQQHDRETLARMLSDALTHTPDLRALCSSGKSYDSCGFCISASDEDSLQRCAVFLSRQAQTTVKDQHEQDKQTESAWESLLAGTTSLRDPNLPFPDMRPLIRDRGVPLHYRPKVWRLLVEHHVGSVRRQLPETYYEDLLARCIIRSNEEGHTSDVDDKTKKQIELDLLRTLPNNRYYENDFADNIVRLRRVLLAFAVHNKEISYCQGLNRLAAIALLFLPEAEAFWCLVCIVEHLMPEQYFTPRLLGPQIDQRVLRVLIAEKLPQLHLHLNRHRLDITMITFNWFLCLFVEELPHAIYLHIWDSFLLEGSKVMFRYALAILKLCEEGIMARTEFMDVSNYLRSVPPPLADIARLRQTAFHWANPLRRRQLKKLRSLHNEEVLVEVAEQEVLRQQYQERTALANTGPTAAQLLQLDEEERQHEKQEVIKQAEEETDQQGKEEQAVSIAEEHEEAPNKLQREEQGHQQHAQSDEKHQKKNAQKTIKEAKENRSKEPNSAKEETELQNICEEGAPRQEEKNASQKIDLQKLNEKLVVRKMKEKLFEELRVAVVPVRSNESPLEGQDSAVEGASTPAKFWVSLPGTDESASPDQSTNTSQRETVNETEKH